MEQGRHPGVTNDPWRLENNGNSGIHRRIGMSSSDYVIRKMSGDEIDLAIEWAASEGWNPGLHDAGSFHEADPEGFLIGVLDNEPIASISVVKYGNSFGFLGFYIVKPAYRGQGYGIRIWKAGINGLSGRNLWLDGVLAQQDNYRKSGFKLAYRNIRYGGINSGKTDEPDGIIPLSEIPFDVVAGYDGPFFPDVRLKFLRAWISQPGSTALGIIHNGRLSGYGVIRPCRSGFKIGPLFADSPELAESLFIALRSRAAPGEAVYLDIPERNRYAAQMAEKYDMKTVFETARMYTGSFPDLPFDRLFGVTTFELG